MSLPRIIILLILLLWASHPGLTSAQDHQSASAGFQNFNLHDLKFSDLGWLPPGSVVTIKSFDIGRIPGQDLQMKVSGARIDIPGSFPVMINAGLKDRFLDVQIKAPKVRLGDILYWLPEDNFIKQAGGVVSDFSLEMSGPPDALKVSGQWRMRKSRHERFLLKDAHGSMEMSSRRDGKRVLWTGHIALDDVYIFFDSDVQAAIKIQRAGLIFKDSELIDPTVEINQARLISPDLTAILLYATGRNGIIDANLYATSVGIQTILKFFPAGEAVKKISGDISNLDVFVRGSSRKPELSGTFKVNKIYNQGFAFVDSPGVFGMTLNPSTDPVDLDGEILMTGGQIWGPNDVALQLDSGQLLFTGDPRNPDFDFKAHTAIDGIKINVSAKGNVNEPDLKLTSNPPKPKDMILVMLATGRSWQGVETSLLEGSVGPDLAADFIDYFIFGGSGAKMAQRFSVRNISLKLDKNTKGINFKKDVSDKAFIVYGVEQSQITGQESVMTQTVGGEYKLSEALSLSAETEIKEEANTSGAEKHSLSDEKIILKFKKEF